MDWYKVIAQDIARKHCPETPNEAAVYIVNLLTKFEEHYNRGEAPSPNMILGFLPALDNILIPTETSTRTLAMFAQAAFGLVVLYGKIGNDCIDFQTSAFSDLLFEKGVFKYLDVLDVLKKIKDDLFSGKIKSRFFRPVESLITPEEHLKNYDNMLLVIGHQIIKKIELRVFRALDHNVRVCLQSFSQLLLRYEDNEALMCGYHDYLVEYRFKNLKMDYLMLHVSQRLLRSFNSLQTEHSRTLLFWHNMVDLQKPEFSYIRMVYEEQRSLIVFVLDKYLRKIGDYFECHSTSDYAYTLEIGVLREQVADGVINGLDEVLAALKSFEITENNDAINKIIKAFESARDQSKHQTMINSLPIQ